MKVDSTKPIITVKEARKLLGKDARRSSDAEVEKLINDLDFIARCAIRQFKSMIGVAKSDLNSDHS